MILWQQRRTSSAVIGLLPLYLNSVLFVPLVCLTLQTNGLLFVDISNCSF